MLIEFSVENFLSFDERVTLSMVVAPELDNPDGLLENTFEAPGGIRLVKSALIYGANASGKSNLVKLLFSNLYKTTPTVEKRRGKQVPVGTIIFDPDGEYFWPDEVEDIHDDTGRVDHHRHRLGAGLQEVQCFLS